MANAQKTARQIAREKGAYGVEHDHMSHNLNERAE